MDYYNSPICIDRFVNSVTSSKYRRMDDLLNFVLEKRSDLTLAFQFNLKELAHLMHAKAFLSDTDHETVTVVRLINYRL